MSCCKTSKWQRKEWDHQMAPTYHTTHSTRHSKSEVFELLSETKGLWIRDFCQKVLPMRFRERQCDYFGKKGMTLHIDVILCRNENGEIEKKAYFTAAFRSDQDFQDTLGEHVILQFTKDFPNVKELYAKSDNAGCYHCKVCPESLFKICKQHKVLLKRLDYNEPQKDQCDRDSAVARSALRSYVDEGNDILAAEDIFTALTASSMKNTSCPSCIFQERKF
jgi:hypothetical protein